MKENNRIFKDISDSVTFLRILYVCVYISVVYWAGSIIVDSDLVQYSADSIFESASAVVGSIMLMVLLMQFHALPKTVMGMIHLFIPYLWISYEAIFVDGGVSVVQVAIIQLVSIFIVYVVWLFKEFVIKAKSKTGGLMQFLWQLLFTLYILGVAAVYMTFLRAYWIDQLYFEQITSVGIAISVLAMAVFTIDAIRAMLKNSK